MLRDAVICFFKDFKFYFASKMIYLVLMVYIMLSVGIMFFANNFYEDSSVNLRQFFMTQPLVFAIVIPALTMRSFSDEYQNRTFEIILSQPISRLSVVIGKFLAVISICGILLASSFVMWGVLATLLTLDNLWILGNYISTFLMCFSLCAVSLFAASFTRYVIGAFILSLGACTILINIDLGWISQLFTSQSLLALKIAGSFNFIKQYNDMIAGQISVASIFYFISLSVSFIWLSGAILDYKRR